MTMPMNFAPPPDPARQISGWPARDVSQPESEECTAWIVQFPKPMTPSAESGWPQ